MSEECGVEAVADWLERNSITNSGAAWLDENIGLIFNEVGEPIDVLTVACAIARGIRQRAWVQP